MGGLEECSELDDEGRRIQGRLFVWTASMPPPIVVFRALRTRGAPSSFSIFEKIFMAQTPHCYSVTSLSNFLSSKNTNNFTMSKRPAELSDDDKDALKSGQRPVSYTNVDAGEFEDEFEDEFESEDEIFEAGVDGRPDDEREAEEREGVRTLHSVCWNRC